MNNCYFIKRKAGCKPAKCQHEISNVEGSYNMFCTSHVFLENRHTKHELLEMYGSNESLNGYIYKYKAHKSFSSFFNKPSKKKKKKKEAKSPYFESKTSSELDDAIKIMGLKINYTKDDVKLAYRVKSLLLHPDKNVHTDTTVQMQQLNAAREVLLTNI